MWTGCPRSQDRLAALQILQRRLASSPAAIYQSLKRRRERLEQEFAEARLAVGGVKVGFGSMAVDDDTPDDLDEYGQDEVEDFEDRIAADATAAETAGQLRLEVATLRSLEAMALGGRVYDVLSLPYLRRRS